MTPNQSTGLELTPEVEGFIKAVSNENRDIGVAKTPFYFPSKDTSFSRIIHSSGDARNYYFIKKFDPNAARFKTILPPAQLENLYTEFYREKGCSVPKTQALDDFTLIMEDCGTETLEDRLRDKSAEQQEAIMASLINEQVKFAIAGREIVVPSNAQDKIEMYSRLRKDFSLNYNYWRPSAEKSELESFLITTAILREQPREQYFLGDNSTFHILFTKTGPIWIDLEKIKKGHQSRELAGLYFSPESKLGFEAIERLIYQFKKGEYESINGRMEEDKRIISRDLKEYLRDFYKSGVIECFRRGTKIRELEIYNPRIYSEFIERHKGYADALNRYRERIGAITQKAVSNGLYDSNEKLEFAKASSAIVDLMSK